MRHTAEYWPPPDNYIQGAWVQDEEETIEVGRMAALRAFSMPRVLGDSALAHFSGQKRPEQPRRKRRQGTHELYAKATRAHGFSRPPLPPSHLIAGNIHRAIADLEPLQFLWVQFAYRPPGLARTQHGKKFLRTYFEQYQRANLSGCKTGTRTMVRYLISVAMANTSRPERAVYPMGEDINPRNWNKTYRPHWIAISHEIYLLDRGAVLALGQKLGEITPIA